MADIVQELPEPNNFEVGNFDQPDSNPRQYKKFLPYYIVAFILVVIISAISYYLGVRSKSEKSVTPSTSVVPITEEDQPRTEPQFSATGSGEIVTYQDTRLKNFSFEYDTSQWAITGKPTDSTDYPPTEPGSPRLTLEDRSGGALVMYYSTGPGMGGSHELFEESQLYRLGTTDFYRIHDLEDGSYDYGRSKNGSRNITLFSDPEVLNAALGECADSERWAHSYSDEKCEEIKAGKFYGQAAQPSFEWSIYYDLVVPLSEINSWWTEDSYQAETAGGQMIVVVYYVGQNPELADEIVKQLRPI